MAQRLCKKGSRMRKRGAWAEWRVGEGERDGGGGLAAAGCGWISMGGAGSGEFVEAAAAPGGVQVTLKWFLVLLPKAVWF